MATLSKSTFLERFNDAVRIITQFDCKYDSEESKHIVTRQGLPWTVSSPLAIKAAKENHQFLLVLTLMEKVWEEYLAGEPPQKEEPEAKVLTLGRMILHTQQRTLTVGEDCEHITHHMCQILAYFMENQGVVITNQILADIFWAAHIGNASLNARQAIHSLKKLLHSVGCEAYLEQVRKGKYVLRVPPLSNT